MENKTYYVYILRCADDTLYCGYTDDLERRLKTHNAGGGAKYTRSRLPVSLAYAERFADKSAAMKREWALKRLTRAQKLRLIADEESKARSATKPIGE